MVRLPSLPGRAKIFIWVILNCQAVRVRGWVRGEMGRRYPEVPLNFQVSHPLHPVRKNGAQVYDYYCTIIELQSYIVDCAFAEKCMFFL